MIPSISLNGDKNIEINADRSELRRVICNLCGNAINYTPQDGRVLITIKQHFL